MNAVDARETSEAAERNKGPILAILAPLLSPRARVLEVASGTGQHVAHFAEALPSVTFQPSEMNFGLHASIRAWTAGLLNVRPPLAIDVTEARWGVSRPDAILAINLVHIAPWDATLGLIDGAASLLGAGGLLVLYGPFSEAGLHSATSNAAFDHSLRQRDPAWGVRDLEDIANVARAGGFIFEAAVSMPANNRILLLRRG